MLPLLVGQHERARASLPAEVYDYFDAGAGAEISAGEAAGSWADFRLHPRVLRDVRTVDCSVRLFGVTLDTPVLVAPVACQTLVHPDGEAGMATGCARAGGLMVLSTRSTTRIEDVAARAGPWWFQVYLMRDRSITRALVARAVDAGAGALVLTGDTPYVGPKPRPTAPVDLDPARFRVNVAPHLTETPDAFTELDPEERLYQDAGATLADIGWLAELSGLPVLVKGVLRGDDALACLDAGAAGVIVSNHGGRQLDRAVPTAHALPEVADAVGDRGLLLVDGGLRTGADVVAARAAGASAVLVGRPPTWALAADGSSGVTAMYTALREDLEWTLALAGCRSLDDVDRSLLASR